MADNRFADQDDLERLMGLASGHPPPTFEEAFAMLDNGTPEDVARQRYDEFVRYYNPGSGAV